MVIGDRFAWGHLFKTGGDATHQLFNLVPDLVLQNDLFVARPTFLSKHESFSMRGVQGKPILALNCRRLPSWVLSQLQHYQAYAPGIRVLDWPDHAVAKELLLRASDTLLNLMTDCGKVRVHRWLRMENLREDFIDFVSALRPLTESERALIRAAGTKEPMPYEHRVDAWFTREQVEALYDRNPVARAVEESVYPQGVDDYINDLFGPGSSGPSR
jgi:hypothetical protein